jgi:DNA-binding NtrC family response regulator
MSVSPERVLCVDDDAQVRALIRRVVVAAGYECEGAGTVDDAWKLLALEEFSVVLCDIGLPGSSGLELLGELGRTRPDIATIMVTGHDHAGIVDAALKLGAYGYITKPFTAAQLVVTVANALHHRELTRDNRLTRQRLESVGELTGVIAHDLNNLLGAILNYATFVAAAAPDNEQVGADLEQIRIAAESAVELSRRLARISD